MRKALVHLHVESWIITASWSALNLIILCKSCRSQSQRMQKEAVSMTFLSTLIPASFDTCQNPWNTQRKNRRRISPNRKQSFWQNCPAKLLLKWILKKHKEYTGSYQEGSVPTASGRIVVPSVKSSWKMADSLSSISECHLANGNGTENQSWPQSADK